MSKQQPPTAISRRQFLAATAATTMLAGAAPAILTASKTDSKVVVGHGDYQYEVLHNWPQLPAPFRWQTTQLDGNNQVVAQLGDDSQRIRSDTKFAIRGDETQWQPGRFVHPHDACFDATGNIYVAEWVATGRVTKLSRLG